MTQKEILVVGAGITGCSIARLLADKGHKVSIKEATSQIGGVCYDYTSNGRYIQKHGSHIFHTNNKDVWDFLSRFTKWTLYQHKVKALINGDLVPIPFNLNSIKFLSDDAIEQITHYLKHNCHYGQEFTLNDLLTNESDIMVELGEFIKEYIFEGYSFKQWGEMPKDEVINRVKAFRYSKDDRYFLDKYQGIPEQGFETMMLRMLNHDNIKKEIFNEPSHDEFEKYDIVFYTGSADALHYYELGELPYRTCKFTYKEGYEHKMQEAAVINCPNDYDYTRVHDYSWYSDIGPSTIVKEYPMNYVSCQGLTPYYPINSKENLELYNRYAELTKRHYPNVILAGRLGTYKYLNMDQSVANAITLVNNF